MMNFFNLTLSEEHFIFPSILNDSFAGYSNLGCRSLSLILGNVIMMCLGVFLLGSNFFGTLSASWTSWKSISFARLGKFSFIVFSNKFFNFLLFLFSFWYPYDSDVGTFKVVPEVSKPLLIFFDFLFLHSVPVEYLFLPFVLNH